MKRFRISLNSWDSYSTFIEAESKEAAEEKAQQLWNDVGPEEFSHKDCGVDFIEAEEQA